MTSAKARKRAISEALFSSIPALQRLSVSITTSSGGWGKSSLMGRQELVKGAAIGEGQRLVEPVHAAVADIAVMRFPGFNARADTERAFRGNVGDRAAGDGMARTTGCQRRYTATRLSGISC